jgi:hypothetical protein
MIPVTRNRKTHVTIGQYPAGCIQPLFAFEREAALWGADQSAVVSNLEYVPGIGMQIKPHQADPGNTYMLSEGSDGVLTVGSGALLVAARMAEFNGFRKATELTGVSYAGSVISSGSPVIQKRVGAGDSFSDNLAADVAIIPSPDTSDDPVNMDRVVVSDADHDPKDTLHFSFFVPGGGLASAQSLLTFFFSGPAGSTKAYVGNGQYALKLRGDGRATLYERCYAPGTDHSETPTWQIRKRFQWQNPSLIFGQRHYFRIQSNARGTSPNIIGDSIAFVTGFGQNSTQNGLIGVLFDTAAIALKAANKKIPVYTIPHQLEAEEDFAACKIRADIRRDIRCVLQIAKSTFPDTGSITDAAFSAERPLYGAQIRLEILGYRPSGTDFSGKILDSTGSEIGSQSVVYDNADAGLIVEYTLPSTGDPLRHLKAQITLEADSGNAKTPFVTTYRVFIPAVYETPDVATVTPGTWASPPALPKSSISNLSINYSDREPQSETASLTIDDYIDECAVLRNRGHIPIKIETEYNADHDRCVLFDGFIQRATGTRMTGTKTGRVYPSAEYRRNELQCVGKWLTLSEAHAPKRFKWIDPQSSGQNLAYKVTDIIRTLLVSVLPTAQVDVPDKPTRYINLNDSTALMFEPGNEIGQYCNDLAHDFLGGWLTYDANAGDDGMWRLKFPKTAPFNPLAIFEIDGPGDGKLAFVDGAYPTLAEWPDAVRLPIRKKTWSEYVEPPEGNIVVVHGFDASVADENKIITNVAVNVESYNFLNLGTGHPYYPDGSSPDFLGRFKPIYVFDPTYGSQDIVDFVCRRVYDAACHAVKYISCEAPLGLVTDPDDAYQRCPRPLAFYDPVKLRLMDGTLEDWLILNVSPSYRKDHVQMARYDIIRPSNLNTSLTANSYQTGPSGYRRNFEQFVKRMTGKSRRDSINTAAAQAIQNRKQDWLGLPESPSGYLQDLDPSSGTFGDFL